MSEPTSFGPYELVARLGAGGMAEVWKATSSGPGGFARTVVLKRILPHLAHDERFLAMFLSEARLSARLHHSNIVDVFACGEIDGRYFLAMEYVHGHDLVALLRAHLKNGPPPPGLASFVIREVCRALAYAHAMTDEEGRPLGLVHRDVSLSNVMVSYDGAVKLLDFGIAKALGELRDAETRSSRLEGKHGYRAPEALAGLGIDGRADQYAAGVVMYELLTGTRLFAKHEQRATRGPVPPPSSVNPQVPAELDRICLRALEPDRERRFASCEEMAIELDRAAHELQWGPQQVAELLGRVLPETRAPVTPLPGTEPLSVPLPTRIGTNAATQVYTLPPWWRHARMRAAVASVLLAGVLAWLVARCGPSTVVEEPPIAIVHDAAVAAPLVTPLPEPVAPALPVAPSLPPPVSTRPGPPSRVHPKGVKHAPSREDLLKGDVLDPFSK